MSKKLYVILITLALLLTPVFAGAAQEFKFNKDGDGKLYPLYKVHVGEYILNGNCKMEMTSMYNVQNIKLDTATFKMSGSRIGSVTLKQGKATTMCGAEYVLYGNYLYVPTEVMKENGFCTCNGAGTYCQCSMSNYNLIKKLATDEYAYVYKNVPLN